MYKVLVFLGVIGLALVACKEVANSNAEQALNFTNIEEAEFFDVPEPETRVIRTQDEWETLWEDYWNSFDSSMDKTPPPEIDFSKHMVIAVFYGLYPQGCTNAVSTIRSIRQEQEQIIVELAPLPELGQCLALVYPAHMVLVEKFELPVKFAGALPQGQGAEE